MTTSTLESIEAASSTIDALIQEAALDWLQAKEVKDAGNAADKVCKTLGKFLETELGADGTVTVNKGGFKTYRLDVSERSRVAEGQVLKALAILHPELVSEIESLKDQHRNPFSVIGLKPVKR